MPMRLKLLHSKHSQAPTRRLNKDSKPRKLLLIRRQELKQL